MNDNFKMNRRSFLHTAGAVGAATLLGGDVVFATAAWTDCTGEKEARA